MKAFLRKFLRKPLNAHRGPDQVGQRARVRALKSIILCSSKVKEGEIFEVEGRATPGGQLVWYFGDQNFEYFCPGECEVIDE